MHEGPVCRIAPQHHRDLVNGSFGEDFLMRGLHYTPATIYGRAGARFDEGAAVSVFLKYAL